MEQKEVFSGICHDCGGTFYNAVDYAAHCNAWRRGCNGGQRQKDDPTFTKRELFAGMAMMNLQNVFLRKSGHDLLEHLKHAHSVEKAEELISKMAVEQADALIKELSK